MFHSADLKGQQKWEQRQRDEDERCLGLIFFLPLQNYSQIERVEIRTVVWSFLMLRVCHGQGTTGNNPYLLNHCWTLLLLCWLVHIQPLRHHSMWLLHLTLFFFFLLRCKSHSHENNILVTKLHLAQMSTWSQEWTRSDVRISHISRSLWPHKKHFWP